MEFTSLQFFLFTGGGVILLHLPPLVRYRALILVAMNAAFIASYCAHLPDILPLAIFLMLGFAIVELIRRHPSRLALGAGIVATIVPFVFFKHYTFLSSVPSWPLPYLVVGFSYILFRLLHMMIDTQAGELPRIRPLAFFNYTCNFLTFVSGPIQRYQDFAESYRRKNDALNPDEVFAVFSRIASGFFKVLVISAIADYLFLSLTRAVLGADRNSAQYGPLEPPSDVHLPLLPIAVIYAAAAVAYTTYLYYNFSGYMDIVIGIGRLLGQQLPENFNRPFLARNFFEFWSRWHMTLSEWFKTYMFNPLLKLLAGSLGSRASMPYLGVLAFFATFLVMGIWHGTTTVFVVYGLFLGAGASANKLWQLVMAGMLGRKSLRALSQRLAYVYFCRGLTAAYFSVALTCFWVNGHQFVGLMRNLGVIGAIGSVALITLAASLAMMVLDLAKSWAIGMTDSLRAAAKGLVLRNLLLAGRVLVILAVSSFFHRAPEFVYRVF